MNKPYPYPYARFLFLYYKVNATDLLKAGWGKYSTIDHLLDNYETIEDATKLQMVGRALTLIEAFSYSVKPLLHLY